MQKRNYQIQISPYLLNNNNIIIIIIIIIIIKQMVLETLESITHKSLNKEKSNNLIPKVDEKIGDVFE